MTVGSLVGALGLVWLVLRRSSGRRISRSGWCSASRIGASLYDPAFATLGRIFGAAARRPITVLTLAGGFASTVGWPATHLLLDAVGWRGTYLVYAALLACVSAPLHAFALPRTRADAARRPADRRRAPPALLPPHGLAFVLVAAAFAAYAFVPSALSAHLLAIFGRAGIDAATVVAIGTLFGPAQVAARVCELVLRAATCIRSRSRAPRWRCWCAAFALLALFGISVASAAAFARDVRRGQRPHHHRARRACRWRCSAPTATAG